MLFSIRRRGFQDENDAQAFLRSCHEGTRGYLRLATRLANEANENVEVARSASELLRHFAEAHPLHELDEAESVIPALAGDTAVADHLTMLANEHALLRSILGQVLPLWRHLATEPAAYPRIQAPLRVATRRLVAVFELHFAREEDHVYPRIALLSAEARATLLAEMRGRRTFVRPS